MVPDKITNPLKVLEKLYISDEYERRLTFKAIHDVIMRSMLFLCTEYYGWRKEVILPQGLNSRWNYLETALKLSNICTEDELSEWRKFIGSINNTTRGRDILKKIGDKKDLERNDLMVLTELIELVN